MDTSVWVDESGSVSRSPAKVELALAIGLGVLGFIGPAVGGWTLTWADAALTIVVCLAVWQLRRWPYAMLFVICVATAVSVVGSWSANIAAVGFSVAVVVFALQSTRSRTLFVAAAASLIFVATTSLPAVKDTPGWQRNDIVPWLLVLFTIALAVQAARATYLARVERERRMTEVREHQEQAAIDAMRAVRNSTRTLLSELQYLLGVLRPDGQSPPTAPVPGLGDIHLLVESFEETGAQIALTMPKMIVGLTKSADVAVYRIVQEALTNVRRHAFGAAVSIIVASEGGIVRINVRNGPPLSPCSLGVEPGALPISGGFGLQGMRERVKGIGGRGQGSELCRSGS